MSIAIPKPGHAVTEFAYETELRTILAPIVASLLDGAAAAGWDRRKAAYTLMFLASKQMNEAGQG